jgi:peptide/nickel transport system permease protein
VIRTRGRGSLAFSLSVLFLLILGAAALAAPLIAPRSPTDQDLGGRFTPPGAVFPLGSDDLGRDILSRIIYGSRSALLVGIVSVGIAVALGMSAGLVAGLAPSAVDNVIMLRIVRAEVLVIKTEEYVEASRALGTPLPVIVFRHIVPNLLGKVIVQASITFALAVVVEASLSYLGLGMQPPAASWGLMLKDARSFLIQAPWMALYPGLALALTVLCFNVIGDTLSERLNPKIR